MLRGRARVVGAARGRGRRRSPSRRADRRRHRRLAGARRRAGRRAARSARTRSSTCRAFPTRLVVVGGGYIACEFASIFNGLGARGDAALSRRADPARLRSRRPRLRRRRDDARRASTSASARRCARSSADADGATRVVLGDGSALDADTVLYATGRAPEHRRPRPRGGRRRARRQRRGRRRRRATAATCRASTRSAT